MKVSYTTFLCFYKIKILFLSIYGPCGHLYHVKFSISPFLAPDFNSQTQHYMLIMHYHTIMSAKNLTWTYTVRLIHHLAFHMWFCYSHMLTAWRSIHFMFYRGGKLIKPWLSLYKYLKCNRSEIFMIGQEYHCQTNWVCLGERTNIHHKELRGHRIIRSNNSSNYCWVR